MSYFPFNIIEDMLAFMNRVRMHALAVRSIVTGTGATGFQISATRDALVSYAATIVTNANIGGNSSGTILLEIAPTNSASAGDWIELARITNGQAISLALALQSTQTVGGNLSGMIPAGYWVKIRSVVNAGSGNALPTFTLNNCQEMLM